MITEDKYWRAIELTRPSGLTRLLWSTLKLSSPPQWKVTGMQGIRYEDSGDEILRDNRYEESEDPFGRLRLPGESFVRGPFSHPARDDLTTYDIELIQFGTYVDSLGREEYLDLGALLEYFKICEGVESKDISSNGIVRGFNEVVSSLSYDELMKRLDNLGNLAKVVVLHRLGYTAFFKGERHLNICDTFRPVMYLVNCFFDHVPYRYYKCLEEATKSLLQE